MKMRCLWVGLLVAATGLFGCGEVDHCEKGVLRCLGGFCDLEGRCDFDLVCAVRNDGPGDRICAKRLGNNNYDFGDGTPAKGTRAEDLQCECEAPELCTVDTNECVNYCEVPEELPGSQPVPEVIFCEHFEGEEPFSFEEICTRRCQLQCQRWEQFCGEGCPADFCESAEVQDACRADCPSGEEELLCLTRECNTVRDVGCGDVVCPDTGAPAECSGLVCQNSCGITPGAWAGDGVCDDGDLFSAATAQCEFGTDCIDCGPRRGAGPRAQPHGELCAFNDGCEGFSRDLSVNAAWCLRLDEVAEGLRRCVPDCSRGQPCPDGYECRVVDAVPGEFEPDDLNAQACVPTTCE